MSEVVRPNEQGSAVAREQGKTMNEEKTVDQPAAGRRLEPLVGLAKCSGNSWRQLWNLSAVVWAFNLCWAIIERQQNLIAVVSCVVLCLFIAQVDRWH